MKQMKIKDIFRIIGIAFVALVAVCCANPGTPTGGPRDKKPPVLVRSVPEPNSTGFSGNIITLTFDENIQLKDQDKKFIISPPLAVQPKLDAHGNILRIRFDSDTLLVPGTTYTLDFADCLMDLNEGNVYENFTFTFSTGESQDSMMISGNVYAVGTIAPVSGIYVMLQQNLADSAFHTVPPVRIAKTDDAGRFAIKNVPADKKYRIFALDDQNRNFLYDQPAEMIAWHEGEVTPGWEIRQINDSVKIDSLSLSADTAEWVYEHVVRDTLVYTPDSLILFAYTEESYDQYIVSDKRSKRNVLNFVFNNRMTTKPEISFPEQDPSVSHGVAEYSLHNDTVTYWITDSLIYKGDSVVVALKYPVLDQDKNFVDKIDTLDMWFMDKPVDKKEEKKNRRNRADNQKKADVPTLKLKVSTSIGVFSVLQITSETPFGDIDWNGFQLKHKVDTIFEPMAFTHSADTVNLRRQTIKADWQPGEEYLLTIDSASVRDVFGLQCNKQESKIKITTLDKYGTLYIIVSNTPENALLQLVDMKGEKVSRQNRVPANGRVAFRYLKPGNYMIRIVEDTNQNGMLDIGNYDDKIEPENVSYYMEKVAVRANWDIKVDFNVADFSQDKFARKFRIKDKKKR